MTIPLLNEQMVLDTLTLPMNSDTLPHICVASRLVLLDEYDRKTTRMNVGRSIDAACQLHTLVGQFRAIAEIRVQNMENEPLQVKYAGQLHELLRRSEGVRRQIVAEMHALMQCPNDEDTIQ